MDALHQIEFQVPETALDGNRHVNNITYMHWMQDAALAHSEATGCTRVTKEIGATWVVRSHWIEYLSPAFAGDRVRVQTWVADLRKVRSLRRYKCLRVADGVVLAQGETDWVFLDAATGRPRAIPDEIRKLFTVAPEQK